MTGMNDIKPDDVSQEAWDKATRIRLRLMHAVAGVAEEAGPRLAVIGCVIAAGNVAAENGICAKHFLELVEAACLQMVRPPGTGEDGADVPCEPAVRH